MSEVPKLPCQAAVRAHMSLALAGLSAAWIFEDGGDPILDVAVAELAAAELDR